MHQHPTTQYATDIVYGRIVSCEYERLACMRHLDDIQKSKTDKNFPYIFDESRANRIFEWFLLCRHVRGCFSGLPIELLPFQKFDLGCIFGWINKKTGIRRFKTAYIRVARGNTKSTMMAGVVNYGMCADAYYPLGKPHLAKYELKPEVVCIAVDRGQAEIVWGDARDMALASPEIRKRLDIQKTKISHKSRGGELRKLSKDTKNKDGGSPCIIIVDEFQDHPTSEVKDKTAYGKGKRSQSLEIIITTAGEDAENKPCKIEDNTVKKILNGEINADTYFGVIREINEKDNPHDQTVWVKANPIFQTMNQYSQSIFSEMKTEHDLAFGTGDHSKIRQWLIKRANRWQVDAENKYFSGCMDKWKGAEISRDEFLALTINNVCCVGVDLSKSIDLTADGFVILLKDGRYAISAHGFMPKNTLRKHEKGDRIPYRQWAEEGWCSITEGDVTDDRFIIQHIHDTELNNKWKIKEVCFDPYSARQFSNVMGGEGYICVGIRQGVQTLSEPTKKFREFVLQGKLVHDGNPLLTWCLSNAFEICDNNGNIKLSKKHKDDTQRIDLIAAVINAMVRAIVNEECTYNKRGMRSI